MAWHLFSTKSLSEPILTYCQLNPFEQVKWNFSQNTTIFIEENGFENIIYKMSAILFQLQYVNLFPPSAAYMRQWIVSALVQIMACRLYGAKPLYEPMLDYYQLGPLGTTVSEILIIKKKISFMKMHLKISSADCQPFCFSFNMLTSSLDQFPTWQLIAGKHL